MSKTITISDETYEKIKHQIKSEKKETTKFQIKTLGGKVLYESTKTNIKEVLEEAVGNDADLNDADLRGAYLEGADLEGADLRDADLGDADFYQAKFYGKSGETKIKKNQIDDFFKALGIIIEN